MKIVVVGLLFLLGLVATSIWIGQSVSDKCKLAKAKYDGDCVEALIKKLEDGQVSVRENNQTVWTLGQLGDKRALPVLKKYYTGQECNHDKYLCQHELSKAIKLLEGGVNVTKMFDFCEQ